MKAGTRWRLALLDLDGTLYRGQQVVPGAPEFVGRLRERNIQPVFFTNNATRTPEEVTRKLNDFGISATPWEVCTSAQAAAAALRRRIGSGTPVAYIGQDGLRVALESEDLRPVHVTEAGFEQVSFAGAVLGLDPEITYSGFARFCAVAMELREFVLTNPDVRLPSGSTFLPGNGALGSFVQTATGISPYVAGKPNPDFVQFALDKYQVSAEHTLIVGDNLATDIACGIHSGVYAVHVQSGVTYAAAERSASMEIQPDEVYPSVAEVFR